MYENARRPRDQFSNHIYKFLNFVCLLENAIWLEVMYCMHIVLRCSSKTCLGVAAAQLSVSITTLAAALFMVQLDLRYDAALSPPRQSDANTCTAVSMVST